MKGYCGVERCTRCSVREDDRTGRNSGRNRCSAGMLKACCGVRRFTSCSVREECGSGGNK
jgi:hypothetical protein